MVELSIIVPVYNVEAYLGRCLQSIASQEDIADNIEVILVDDGSSDGSGRCCDEFVKDHTYASIIHKKNGGLSDARNVGMRAANGRYCLFLDSDDALTEGCCKRILDILKDKDVDVLYGQVNWIFGNGETIYKKRGFAADVEYRGDVALLQELKSGKYIAMAQIGIYKLRYLKDNELYFKRGILHEDEQWSPRVMMAANKVMRTDLKFYNYYIRENSITQNVNLKRYYDLLQTISELKGLYDHSASEELKKYGLAYLGILYMKSTVHLINAKEKVEIDYRFLRSNLHGIKNYLRYLLFLISPKIYLKMIGN